MRIITTNKFYADRQSEWLSKDPPDWFKEIKPDRKTYGMSSGWTRFCPSFVELFENSLVLKSPADIEIFYEWRRADPNISSNDIESLQIRCADYMNQREFVSFNNHNLFKDISHFYGAKYINFKIELNVLLVSDKVEQMIYFPPEYHDRSEEASMVNAQVGIFETIPNRGVQSITNMKIERKSKAFS